MFAKRILEGKKTSKMDLNSSYKKIQPYVRTELQSLHKVFFKGYEMNKKFKMVIN